MPILVDMTDRNREGLMALLGMAILLPVFYLAFMACQ